MIIFSLLRSRKKINALVLSVSFVPHPPPHPTHTHTSLPWAVLMFRSAYWWERNRTHSSRTHIKFSWAYLLMSYQSWNRSRRKGCLANIVCRFSSRVRFCSGGTLVTWTVSWFHVGSYQLVHAGSKSSGGLAFHRVAEVCNRFGGHMPSIHSQVLYFMHLNELHATFVMKAVFGNIQFLWYRQEEKICFATESVWFSEPSGFFSIMWAFATRKTSTELQLAAIPSWRSHEYHKRKLVTGTRCILGLVVFSN